MRKENEEDVHALREENQRM